MTVYPSSVLVRYFVWHIPLPRPHVTAKLAGMFHFDWILSVWKGKVVLIHVMKTYRESGRTDPLILNFGTRWKWMVSWTACPLYRQERTPVPLLGDVWAPELLWTFWKREIFLALAGIRTPDLPSRSLVTISTWPVRSTTNAGRIWLWSLVHCNPTLFERGI